MPKVKLTVTESRCREKTCQAGDTYLVETLCPPLCHELWNAAYPYVFALLGGAALDHGEERAFCFDVACPDGGLVKLHGERVDDEEDKP